MVDRIYGSTTTDTQKSTEDKIADLGVLRFEVDGTVFRYVKNADAAATIVGDTVVWNSATTQTDIKRNVLVGDPLVAGVCVSAIPINGFGWIQVKGQVTVIADATLSAGDFIVTGGDSNTGRVKKARVDTITNGQNDTYAMVGIMEEAATAAQSKLARISILR